RDLFQGWGAIPDPDCCVPGSPNCPAKSLDETYGFQWCPGDDELLKFVGREGYRDPACDFRDAPFNMSTPHGAKDQRQSACDLRLSPRPGVPGLPNSPTPLFEGALWENPNGGPPSGNTPPPSPRAAPATPDARVNRLFDGSIEPPFRIGMACGACHI